MVVQHVNIQGLGRTKEDLLGYEISDVFHARNLIEVCTGGCEAAGEYLGFYRVLTDVSTGDEEGSRGPAAPAAPGNLQGGGSPHRYV